jgi:hypothetical protein
LLDFLALSGGQSLARIVVLRPNRRNAAAAAAAGYPSRSKARTAS